MVILAACVDLVPLFIMVLFMSSGTCAQETLLAGDLGQKYWQTEPDVKPEVPSHGTQKAAELRLAGPRGSLKRPASFTSGPAPGTTRI